MAYSIMVIGGKINSIFPTALGVSNSQERGVKMSKLKLILLRILFLVMFFIIASGMFESLFIKLMERMGF